MIRSLRAGRRLAWVLVSLLGSLAAAQVSAQDADGAALASSFIWTAPPGPSPSNGAFVAFRKAFQLVNATNAVTMQIFADARYLLWANGQYVQRGPGRFEPQAPEYDTINLTPFLHAGTNAVAVLVASRLSNGRVRMHAPGLTARVTQGGQDLFATDAAWKYNAQTRYTKATADWPNIYDEFDARVENGDWTATEYDDSAWSAAQAITNAWGPLTASRIPPLRETVVTPDWGGTVWPVTLASNQQVTFQFPRLVQAYVEIELDADEGSVLQLTYSTPTKITCRAGIQTYLSTDTHWIYAGGLLVKSGRITLRSVRFVERLYPFDRIGQFDSSDALLNKLWTTCVRGLEVVSEDAYVDCADRERVEWMDCDPPVFDVTRVAMAGPAADGSPIHADPRLLETLLRRTAYTLQTSGWVKAHTCSDRFDIHARMEDRACDWVQGARRYYESCGKTNVIQEIWPAIVTQMNYFLARRSPRGLVLAREWVVWGNPVGYQTCEGTALNAFVQRALVDAAYLGNVIGETAQAAIFAQAATDLAAAINSVLWDESAGTYRAGWYDLAIAQAASDYRALPVGYSNNLIVPTRHAALFALDQGCVPADRRARVTQHLLANAPTDNNIMQYYYFFRQQYAADNATQDVSVLDTIRGSWADVAVSPYEATLEGLHATGSKAHCYGMFPAYFLSAYVLGVRLEGPVWDHRILVEPRLGDLDFAQGVVVTEHGPVPVAWSRTNNPGRLDFSLVIPPGTRATVHLPRASDTNTLVLNGDVLVDDGVVTAGVGVTGRWFVLDLPAGTNSGSVTLPARAMDDLELTSNFYPGDVAPALPCSSNDLLQTALEAVSPPASGNNFTGGFMRNGTTGTASEGLGGTGTNPANIIAAGTYDFLLDTNAAPAGYDLAAIVTYSGWIDNRAGQDHALWYQCVGSNTFTLLTNLSVAASAGALRVAVNREQGVLASGVRAVRVVLNQTHFVYREIDVLGQPTVIAPLLLPAAVESNRFRVSFSAALATNYRVEASADLAGWTNVFTTNTPAMTIDWLDDDTSLYEGRFYRAVLGP